MPGRWFLHQPRRRRGDAVIGAWAPITFCSGFCMTSTPTWLKPSGSTFRPPGPPLIRSTEPLWPPSASTSPTSATRQHRLLHAGFRRSPPVRGQSSRAPSTRRVVLRRRTSRHAISCWHSWLVIARIPPPSCLWPWALIVRRYAAGSRNPADESAEAVSPVRLGRVASTVGAAGRCPAGQRITVVGDPAVDALSQPGETGGHEQRADRTPYRVTFT